MSSDQQRTLTEKWKWRRREAIIRDDYTCMECGARGGPKGEAKLEVHHMTPVAKGGSDELENLETLCQNCHRTGRENPGWFNEQYAPEEFVAAIESGDGFVGTQDVADDVGCSYELAYKRLRALVEDGTVASRKVANARVWFVDDE